VVVHTIGHGTRPLEELLGLLTGAGVQTLVDVRRFPGSRRNPQFNRGTLEAALAAAGIAYRHTVDLGGRLADEPGEERFQCIRIPAFRAYAARMGTDSWQEALAAALAEPGPALMCSETPWTKCHRRLIAELLHARGHEVRHLVRPGRTERHVPWAVSETRSGRLYLCGVLVA
jgi:uncharacterized protein (DUF488 family)